MKRALFLGALVLLATACGGVETGGGGNAGKALDYLAADSATVILVSTDVDGEQWDGIDEHVYRPFAENGDDAPATLEGYFVQTAEEIGLDWDDDVKPLLGNDIAIGIEGEPFDLLGGEGESGATAALETREGDLEDVLEKAGLRPAGEASGATLYRRGGGGSMSIAVDGDVLVVSEDEDTLRRALARPGGGGGLDVKAVEEAFADLPEEALVRAYGTAERLADQEQLRRFASLPLMEALESWALTARFARDELDVDAVARLDESKVDEEDLPLVTGEESPEIVLRDREISGGNRNQSQTTVFLLRALRLGYPDSRFIEAVDAVEKELGIDFEEEILRQFDGPSASYVSPDGRTFAARSEVRDPEALRALLPRLAPHLPQLAEGLQGLQSQGMALLFLFAPDAPAAAPMQGVTVDPPETEDGLYRISGLTGDGPSELHLGLIGDVFVVASSEEAAREIAEAPTREAEGAKGAGVLRADLGRLGRDDSTMVPFPFDAEELVASLQASTKELRARVRVELD
ncbi:MAG TPA: hypothetical protein VFM13_13115 [Gaiellaceae bacterium]|nr:hypothetical protein [Gaiellaceae bacterium]